MSIRTHREVLGIAADLLQELPRENIRASLKPEHAELLNGSIDLTARLISMMDIGTLQYGFSGRKGLVWNQGSLKDFVHDHFNHPVMLRQDVKLEKVFNARNLDRIVGIKVEWTDNLADHLRMMDDESRVAIFHHASFLKLSPR